MSNYDFTDTTANGLEINNPHTSLETMEWRKIEMLFIHQVMRLIIKQ